MCQQVCATAAGWRGCRRRVVGIAHIASACFTSVEISLGVCSAQVGNRSDVEHRWRVDKICRLASQSKSVCTHQCPKSVSGGCRRRAVGRVHIASTCFASLEIILGVCSDIIAGTVAVLFESLAGVQWERHMLQHTTAALHAGGGRGGRNFRLTAAGTHSAS